MSRSGRRRRGRSPKPSISNLSPPTPPTPRWMPACVPTPPPNLTGSPEGPEQFRQWQLRWCDLAALELILRARRVIDHTGAYHLCQGRQIPAYLDPQRDPQDAWSWVLATTCPRFHQDLTQVAQLEAVALSDGVDELFAHTLTTALIPTTPRSTPPTPPSAPDTLTPADSYRLITASPEVRLLALVATYWRAIADGLLMT